MYKIVLYENGRLCTQLGGDIRTLPEALDQLAAAAKGLQAEDFPPYVGFKFDRAGTPCAIVIANEWGQPIIDSKED